MFMVFITGIQKNMYVRQYVLIFYSSMLFSSCCRSSQQIKKQLSYIRSEKCKVVSHIKTSPIVYCWEMFGPRPGEKVDCSNITNKIVHTTAFD